MAKSVTVARLQSFSNIGGDVLHALKVSDTGFSGFGEAYFSWIRKGSVKGWKRHKQMTMNLIVPLGQVRFVFLVNREGDKPLFVTEEIGQERYARITVLPDTWFAFQGLGTPSSLVLNIADIPHNPNEVERLDLSDIDYVWGL